MHRNSKTQRQYKAYVRTKTTTDECDFCAINQHSPQFVRQSTHFKIIKNLFPYHIWDAQPVTDHLMIVPDRHISSFTELTASESQEYLQLLNDYDHHGYNVYTRAAQSKAKSVVHLHTHLIKTEGPFKKMIFTLRKPYRMVTF